jgi:uncharacterized protein RhaS with RHS repeats
MPNLGRWLNRDPLQEQGGINLYAYVNGDPMGYVDPDGRMASPPMGKANEAERANDEYWNNLHLCATGDDDACNELAENDRKRKEKTVQCAAELTQWGIEEVYIEPAIRKIKPK